jgi:hypothetical protein
MSRLAPLLVTLLAALTATGCYAPERMPASTTGTQSQTAEDECTGDCQVCADYCTAMILCSADPPTVQDCAYDCFNALDASTPDCTEARRDAMECVGALSCEEFSSTSVCASEFETFEIACDGEYDDEPMPSQHMIAG